MTFRTVVLCGPAGCGKKSVADMFSRKYGYVQIALADAIKRFCGRVFRVPKRFLWGSSAWREKAIDAVRLPIDDPAVEELLMNELGRLGIADGDERLWKERLVRVIARNAPITTARRLLQLVGTEWARELDPLFWCRHALIAVQGCANSYTYSATEGLSSEPSFQIAYVRHAIITDGRFENELQFFAKHSSDSVNFWVDDSRRNPNRPPPTHSSEPTRASLGPYCNEIDNNLPMEQVEEFVGSDEMKGLIFQ
jgi:hypothetical protein